METIPCPLGAHTLEEADMINCPEVHKRSAKGEWGSEWNFWGKEWHKIMSTFQKSFGRNSIKGFQHFQHSVCWLQE